MPPYVAWILRHSAESDFFFFSLSDDILDGAQDALCSHPGRIHQRDGKQGGTHWQLLVRDSS